MAQITAARALWIAVATLFCAAAVAGDELSRGQAKASMCLGCHAAGHTRSTFPQVYSIPRIMGQSREYIVYALNEYRANRRNFPNIGQLATMPAIAASLNDEDIEDLADYFSSLTAAAERGK